MAERPVSPRECALATTFPLTWEQFRDDLEPGAVKDFAKSQRKRYALSDEKLWSQWARVADLMREVQSDAARLGVKVVPRATVEDVAHLVGAYHVVTVFAHAHFVKVEPADILDPVAFLLRVRLGEGRLFDHIRARLGRDAPHLLDDATVATLEVARLREEIARHLNELLEPSRAFYETSASDAPGERNPSEFRLVRVALELAFPGELAAAPSIEFGDALETAAVVVGVVPKGFDGVLDLSICNSVVPGEAIKRKHRGCLVIVNEWLTPISFRLALYRFTLRELGRQRQPYTTATMNVRKALIEIE